MRRKKTHVIPRLRLSILTDLTEHIRKQKHKYRHELEDAAGDAWRCAIFMTPGWPRPGESAAEPEAR